MTRILGVVLGAAIAVSVPAVLAVTGLRIVTNDWYVRALYDRGAVPDDRYGLADAERERLAIVGLRSIEPGSEGVELLRRARLPDGGPAFGMREVAHMQDVRDLLARAYAFQLVALAAVAVLALLLALRRSTRTLVPVALMRGALLTLALAAVVAVVSLVDYESFEKPFHGLFFEGDSWRFAETDTLRRLYPDEFWLDTAIVVGVLAVFQAVLLYPLARLWAARARARQAPGRGARTQEA